MFNSRSFKPGSRISNGYCPACGQPVDLIMILGGTRLLINPVPVFIRRCWDGTGQTYVLGNGKYAFGKETTADDSEGVRAYIPHRGVCPEGGRRRRLLR